MVDAAPPQWLNGPRQSPPILGAITLGWHRTKRVALLVLRRRKRADSLRRIGLSTKELEAAVAERNTLVAAYRKAEKKKRSYESRARCTRCAASCRPSLSRGCEARWEWRSLGTVMRASGGEEVDGVVSVAGGCRPVGGASIDASPAELVVLRPVCVTHPDLKRWLRPFRGVVRCGALAGMPARSWHAGTAASAGRAAWSAR